MSRIGRRAIAIPDGVSIERRDGEVHVKGPRGSLSERLPAGIELETQEGEVRVKRRDDKRQTRALHGLVRALVANMVTGVSEGFAKELEIQGVGYRAEADQKKVTLVVGYSHPVVMEIPKGLAVKVEGNTRIRVEGTSRQDVGQFAANLRAVRPPEPYKGKGIRYANEYVRRKVGKAGASA